jgi:arsenate reductase
MAVTIYHNPNCGTSRNALALLRGKKIDPVVIEYLKTPPTLAELKALVKRTGIPVRELLRTKEALYDELDLGNPKWTDAELLGFLAEHPKLMNRPVVETEKGAKACRPAEMVLELL